MVKKPVVRQDNISASTEKSLVLWKDECSCSSLINPSLKVKKKYIYIYIFYYILITLKIKTNYLKLKLIFI